MNEMHQHINHTASCNIVFWYVTDGEYLLSSVHQHMRIGETHG